jgi:hypothetical protein
MQMQINENEFEKKDSKMEEMFEELSKELLEHGVDSILENGSVIVKMPVEMFFEFALDFVKDMEIER